MERKCSSPWKRSWASATPNHKLAGTEVEFAPLLDIPGFKIVYGTVAAVYLREGKTWDAESEVLVPFPRVPSAFTVTVHSGIDFDGHEVDINPPYNVFMRAPRVNWGRVAE